MAIAFYIFGLEICLRDFKIIFAATNEAELTSQCTWGNKYVTYITTRLEPCVWIKNGSITVGDLMYNNGKINEVYIHNKLANHTFFYLLCRLYDLKVKIKLKAVGI